MRKNIKTILTLNGQTAFYDPITKNLFVKKVGGQYECRFFEYQLEECYTFIALEAMIIWVKIF